MDSQVSNVTLVNLHVRGVSKMDCSVNIYPPDGADAGNQVEMLLSALGTGQRGQTACFC
jgi:hypothetical protein